MRTILSSICLMLTGLAILSVEAAPSATPRKKASEAALKAVPLPAPHMITLHFPARSVGRLTKIKLFDGLHISAEALPPPSVNARGDIEVSSDQALSLLLNYDGAADTSFLTHSDMREAMIVQVDMHGIESATDDSLKPLGGLPHLHRILFTSTDITDEGWKYLKSAKKLYAVTASGSLLKGPGLANLKDLPLLETLAISRTNLRNFNFEDFPTLKNLKYLSISNCVLQDDACTYLGKLTSLMTMDLAKNKVTDKGIMRLEGLKNLSEINLAETQISKRATESLRKLPVLVHLTLLQNQMSPAALSDMKKALPRCTFDLKINGNVDANLFSPLK